MNLNAYEARHLAEFRLVATVAAAPAEALELARRRNLEQLIAAEEFAAIYNAARALEQLHRLSGDRLEDRGRLFALACAAGPAGVYANAGIKWNADPFAADWPYDERAHQALHRGNWSPAIVAAIFEAGLFEAAYFKQQIDRLEALAVALVDAPRYEKRAREIVAAALEAIA